MVNPMIKKTITPIKIAHNQSECPFPFFPIITVTNAPTNREAAQKTPIDESNLFGYILHLIFIQKFLLNNRLIIYSIL